MPRPASATSRRLRWSCGRCTPTPTGLTSCSACSSARSVGTRRDSRSRRERRPKLARFVPAGAGTRGFKDRARTVGASTRWLQGPVYELMLDGPPRHLGARPKAKLVPNFLHMTFNCSLGEEQLLGDVSIGHAAGDKLRHLDLPPAQRSRIGTRVGRVL